MHNNTTENPLGIIKLYVSRNGLKHYLRFFIVDSDITPILGRDSCIGMMLVQILDSDTIHKVSDNTELPSKLTQDSVLKDYTDVFTGMGELAGEYTIHTDPNVSPIVHPPCRLLQDAVKSELDAMVEEVIVPVTESTPWVSSM